MNRRDRAMVIVDMGGGYGGPIYEHLSANDVEVVGHKGAETATGRTHDKKLGFFNLRSQVIWRFREALDPDQPGGSPIALPDDPELIADLSAPTLDLSFNGIKVESKEKVTDRLGRSTNKGDAAVMSWSAGPKQITHALDWLAQAEQRKPLNRRPVVVMGRQSARR